MVEQTPHRHLKIKQVYVQVPKVPSAPGVSDACGVVAQPTFSKGKHFGSILTTAADAVSPVDSVVSLLVSSCWEA